MKPSSAKCKYPQDNHDTDNNHDNDDDTDNNHDNDDNDNNAG